MNLKQQNIKKSWKHKAHKLWEYTYHVAGTHLTCTRPDHTFLVPTFWTKSIPLYSLKILSSSLFNMLSDISGYDMKDVRRYNSWRLFTEIMYSASERDSVSLAIDLCETRGVWLTKRQRHTVAMLWRRDTIDRITHLVLCERVTMRDLCRLTLV